MAQTAQRPPDADHRPAARRVLPGWWPWGAGLLLGLVVLGPGLGGGSLLSLDLLVTPDIPVPNGVYGLGPALSQRVPLFALVGAGSALVGGPAATKVLLVACTAVGFAGAARLARVLGGAALAVGPVGQAAAGLLWAGGPYALTRVAAGHVNLVWVVAVLPWALPRLGRPTAHVPSTYLAALALALGGPGGGTLGLGVGVVGLVVGAGRQRWGRATAAVLVPHLVWVLPTAVLLWAGAGVTGAGGFATWVEGSSSWAAVVAGNGFWRWDVQVGAAGWVGAVGGVVLAGLAALGGVALVRARGWRSWSGVATVAAGIGLALATASALPGVRTPYRWLSELSVGAPLRESHRWLALWLVWAAPAAAIGAAVAARTLRARLGARPIGRLVPVVAGVPLALALVLSVSGWWGLDGRLEPVDYPPGWGEVRSALAGEAGVAVAFPWSEYPPLSFAGDRQVFNPVPQYLGGDVISSYDPVFDPEVPAQEQVDQRAQVVDRLAAAARAGEPVGDRLGELGVRWVVVVHESNWEDYASLFGDPGLDLVIERPDVDLYEVRSWSGAATGPDGAAYDLERPIPPVLRTDAPRGSVLHVAGAPGWIQGWATPATVTVDGELHLEGDAGVLWFWPAIPLAVVDAALLVGAVLAFRSRRAKFGRFLAPRDGARVLCVHVCRTSLREGGRVT